MTRRDIALSRLLSMGRQFSPRLYGRLAWTYKRWRGAFALRVVDACVRPGDVVVDIGASWGLYVGHLARLVGARGHVHAIEPDPAMAPRLRAIQRFRPNVSVYQLALSDRAGTATLNVPILAGRRLSALGGLDLSGARAALAREHVPVRVERLDAVLPAGGPAPAFIKCDAEGHEFAVLRGADGILHRYRPTLLVALEARHHKDDIQRCFDYLLALGYRGFALYGDGLRPLEAFDLQRDQLAFLGGEFIATAMPRGYVQHFLFVRPTIELAGLMSDTRCPSLVP